MILVLLGTFDIEFKRPLIELERLCQEGVISEEVIVQNGYTDMMDSKYLTYIPFIKPDELTKLHEQARIIITHAGTGSLFKAVKFNKKVIAIARLAKYEEHVDDHQVEILEKFTALNYVFPWHEGTPLAQVLKEVEDFTPAKFAPNQGQIIDYLTKYIDSL